MAATSADQPQWVPGVSILVPVIRREHDGPEPVSTANLGGIEMRYLLLIYTSELDEPSTPDAQAAQLAEYDAFSAWIREKGHLRAGDALQPTTTATTVRVRDGRTVTTDGPFAETKEALGGFYMIECANLDEAIEAAARIPGARYGSIEVRPIWDLPSMGAAEALAAAT